MGSFALWIIFLVCFSNVVNGADIEFSGIPAVFHPLQEDLLTLRCGILELPSSSVVGRDLSHLDLDQDSSDLKRQTSSDHVTSIVISLGGKDVATLNDNQVIRVHGDHDVPNLKVTGSLKGSSDQLGYLQLAWTNPQRYQTGDFKCDVTGIDNNGPFVLNKPMNVGFIAPPVDEIVESLLALKFNISSGANNSETHSVDHSVALDVLETNLTSQANEIEFLKANYFIQEKELNDLKDKNNQTEKENADLKVELYNLTSQVYSIAMNGSNAGAKIGDLDQTLLKQQDNITFLTSSFSIQHGSLFALQNDFNQLSMNGSNAGAKINDLERELNQLEAKNNQTDNENAYLKVDLRNLTSQVDAMSMSNSNAGAKIIVLEKELNALQIKNNNTEKDNSDLNAELLKLTSTVNAISTSGTNSGARINDLDKTLAKHQDSITTLSASLSSQNGSLSTLQHDYSQLKINTDSSLAGIVELVTKFDSQNNTVSDLATKISGLEKDTTDNEKADAVLAKNILDASTKLSTVASDVTSLTQNYNDVNMAQQNMTKTVTSQLGAINAEVAHLGHVESGRISCGDSMTWTGLSVSGSQKYNQIVGTFNTTYTRPPTVHMARQFINDWEDTNFFNYILLNNVTTSGFVATCGAAAQNEHVKAMWISWIAIPGA